MKIILDDLSRSSMLKPPPSKTSQTPEPSPNNESISTCEDTSSDNANDSDIMPIKQITSSGSFLSLNQTGQRMNKKQLNNLISIKTSATLGAIPDLSKSSDSIGSSSLTPLVNKRSSNANYTSFDIQNCNDEIATVQGLVENKFSGNSTGDFFEKFNLPVLRLVNENMDIEDCIENNMITSEFQKIFILNLSMVL